jgi:hypothetical protein
MRPFGGGGGSVYHLGSFFLKARSIWSPIRDADLRFAQLLESWHRRLSGRICVPHSLPERQWPKRQMQAGKSSCWIDCWYRAAVCTELNRGKMLGVNAKRTRPLYIREQVPWLVNTIHLPWWSADAIQPVPTLSTRLMQIKCSSQVWTRNPSFNTRDILGISCYEWGRSMRGGDGSAIFMPYPSWMLQIYTCPVPCESKANNSFHGQADSKPEKPILFKKCTKNMSRRPLRLKRMALRNIYIYIYIYSYIQRLNHKDWTGWQVRNSASSGW